MRRKRRLVDTTRSLHIERLEERALFVAEGAPYQIDQTVNVSGLLGSISAVAQWGDGSQSQLSVVSPPSVGPIRVRFDYSYDTTGFFNAQERRTVLQAAADNVFSKFADSLASIAPSGTNTWTRYFSNPTTGALTSVPGGTIATNEIVIYPGARDLPGKSAAEAGPGGLGWSGTPAWGQLVAARGQAGAVGPTLTDVAPWGGSMTVDPNFKWHFGTTTSGLDSDEYDFLSVVSHEFMHVLGFGISRSDAVTPWARLISNGRFVGPFSVAANGGQTIQLDASHSHWIEGTQNYGQEALMDPSINSAGIRKLPTPLDLAGLQDIGWQLISQQTRVSGTKIFGDDGNYNVQIVLSGSSAGQLTVSGGNASVTNVAPTLETRTTTNARVNVPLSIVDLGKFTDPGFGANETFSYEINWGDGTSVDSGAATIDNSGGANVLTRGSFNGTHIFTSVGNYSVTFRVKDDDGGLSQQVFAVQVAAAPELRLSLSTNSVSESSGAAAATLTVDLVGFDTSTSTTVLFSSSDTTEATVGASVIIPSGSSRGTVNIVAIDDLILDGTQVVTFGATSGSITAARVTFSVTDSTALALALTSNRVREDAGQSASILRITRSNLDRLLPVTVLLTSTNAGIQLPATVVIPASQGFIDVGIGAVDDSLLNGPRTGMIHAVATGYAPVETSITVDDFEPMQWVGPPVTFNEGQSAQPTVVLTLPGPAIGGGVLVTLASSAPNQVSVPATIVIGPGAQQVIVPLTIVNDGLSENTQSIQITATGLGYNSSTFTVNVIDNDRSEWTNPNNIFDVNGDNSITPADALIIINFLNRRGSQALSATRSSDELYWFDVSGNSLVEPLDVLRIINFLNRRTTSTSST